jgi:hypothetical protein
MSLVSSGFSLHPIAVTEDRTMVLSIKFSVNHHEPTNDWLPRNIILDLINLLAKKYGAKHSMVKT